METLIAPNKPKGSFKLTHEQQQQIKQWFAEDWGPAVVAKFVKDEFGIDISRPGVFHYSKQYEAEIAELRAKIKGAVDDVPISQKVIRQKRREDIYQRYMNKGKLEEARQVLNDAQEEMEPKIRGIHVTASATSEATIDPTTARKRIARNMRIIQELGLGPE